VDAFSEVLSSVKLKGALFFHAEFSAPWSLLSPQSKSLAPHLMPDAGHLVIFHFVLSGSARIKMDQHDPLVLSAGDIVVFPHGDPHCMENGVSPQSLDPAATVKLLASRNLGPVRAGGGGEVTRFVCGYMACDPQLCQPILAGLPPVIRIHIGADSSGRRLENNIRQLVEEAEAAGPGTDAMLAKLAETLFVDALRRYVVTLPEEQLGWLAGARDPVVGRSLAILHNRVNHPWTISELAREVGLSRSSLVERFTRYLGEPPISYLTQWRLQLGARALAATPRSVAEIASDVGYESEAAFNRAFKRQFGVPPARYRRERREEIGLTASRQAAART
jgi:AraC-like DNA-binding protein